MNHVGLLTHGHMGMLGGRGLVPFRACIWVQQRRCAVAVARCTRHAWMGSVSVARMQSVMHRWRTLELQIMARLDHASTTITVEQRDSMDQRDGTISCITSVHYCRRCCSGTEPPRVPAGRLTEYCAVCPP
jgi:hypothetical protein